ncbi:MAG: hypothetical protein JXR26_00890 [Balneolaceae bacterium]|nr:hypothetical protein [Balneolaceae bacterium]
MQMLSSDQIIDHISNIIHEETQLHRRSIDLTVADIKRPAKVGALDFGGSEFKPMGTETIEAVKQNSDDDYGWWRLQAGMYQAEFNESLSLGDDTVALLSLHAHASAAGIVSSARIINDNEQSLNLNFQVPKCGCNVKENARFATLVLLQP